MSEARKIDIDVKITLRDPRWFHTTGQRVFIREKIRSYLDQCGWTVAAGRQLFQRLREMGQDPVHVIQRLCSRCYANLPPVDPLTV